MKTIAILIPYFGKFPEWADLYFETLKKNSTIDFIFYTDCDYDSYKANNIRFIRISFNEYIEWVNAKIDADFKPANSYKLCDLRPLFGYLHQQDFVGYDFYGWTDMDVLFGDIRSFYNNEVLENYDVISTHSTRISGHLALFRNTPRNISMYKQIYNWKEKLSFEEFVGIDEHGITNAYTMTWFDKFNEKFSTNINNVITRWLKRHKTKRLYLVEQYTTPFRSYPWLDGTKFGEQPNVWYYKDGTISNNRDGEREFIYIHFMNFKSSQWRNDGSKAPWEDQRDICRATVEDMKTGVVIDSQGIRPIPIID